MTETKPKKARTTMTAPVRWDLSALLAESHEAWVCTRISQFFSREDEPGQLIELWKLDNYHYNIGIFVVGIATKTPDQDTVRYYIVVRMGSQFFFVEQKNEPLDALLALNGDTVFTDFLERVFDKVIEPTEEQIRAFVEQFPQATERWLAATMNEEFREHPSHLYDSRLLQAVFDHYENQEQHLRAQRYFSHWWEKAQRYEFPQPEWTQLREIIRGAWRRLYEWWKQSPCVDYAFPPPPAIDHDRRRFVSNFPYKGKTYKRVEAYGQVAVIPVMMEFHSREKPGYDLVDVDSHKEISSWLPTNPGGLEAARDFARLISRLTDLSQVSTFTRQQMYGAEIRIHDLLCTTHAKYDNPPSLTQETSDRATTS